MPNSSAEGNVVIRNFIYLDSEKLRSLSSQLFEGVTDLILKREADEVGTDETQKGPVGSGRVLADIFRQERSSTELRFLEDHAYTLFENEILNSNSVIDIEINSSSFDLKEQSFVRVTGKLEINDTRATTDLISGFNSFGASLYRVINNSSLEAKAIGKQISDKDIEKSAKAEGMQMDAKFLASLADLIKFGFKGMIEFQILQASKVFSAPLKREYLRESEELIIQKYSRQSEANFTLVGILTQVGKKKEALKQAVDVKGAANLKYALRSMGDHMHNLEESFSGVDDSEIIVDPIAVYRIL